jgi:hypothetical protein
LEKAKKVQRKDNQTADKTTTSAKPIQEMNALELQRMVGNRQTQRLLADTPALKPSTFIQTKMSVGAADDPYEREADAVAQQVMSSPTDAAAPTTAQRAGEEDEMMAKRDIMRAGEEDEMMAKRDIMRAGEDDEMMAKRDTIQRADDEIERMPILQRAGEDDEMMAKRDIVQREGEDDEMMAKRDIMRAGDDDMMGSFEVGGDIENQINSARGGGSPLPDDTRGFMENRMGYDFGGVRVHTGGQSDSLNRSISAKAFTTGSDIFMKSNEYNPQSDSGKQLLAHELTHVVQQGHASAKVQTERDDTKK